MGATSVTGKGLGAARTQKGPGNGRNFNVPQVNPHIVAAGVATLASNAAAVAFSPALPEVPAHYAVVVMGVAAGDIYVTKAGTTTFTGFTITSANATGEVDWVVVKCGLGLDIARAD